jgi:hypothetical protein
MDKGTVRNMGEVYSKNKFEKLVHLVGFHHHHHHHHVPEGLGVFPVP